MTLATKPPYEIPNYFWHDRHRIVAFWHQVKEITKCNPENILEIGIGYYGFTARELKHTGYHVTTMDIDPAINPDVVGDIRNLSFPNKSFDVVAAFETLEHIPYEDFVPALRELGRVSKKHIIISLPDNMFRCQFKIRLPRFDLEKLIPVPWLNRRGLAEGSSHYWEVNMSGHGLDKVFSDFKKAGLTLEYTFLPFEYYRRRFFKLKVLE